MSNGPQEEKQSWWSGMKSAFVLAATAIPDEFKTPEYKRYRQAVNLIRVSLALYVSVFLYWVLSTLNFVLNMTQGVPVDEMGWLRPQPLAVIIGFLIVAKISNIAVSPVRDLTSWEAIKEGRQEMKDMKTHESKSISDEF